MISASHEFRAPEACPECNRRGVTPLGTTQDALSYLLGYIAHANPGDPLLSDLLTHVAALCAHRPDAMELVQGFNDDFLWGTDGCALYAATGDGDEGGELMLDPTLLIIAIVALLPVSLLVSFWVKRKG